LRNSKYVSHITIKVFIKVFRYMKKEIIRMVALKWTYETAKLEFK